MADEPFEDSVTRQAIASIKMQLKVKQDLLSKTIESCSEVFFQPNTTSDVLNQMKLRKLVSLHEKLDMAVEEMMIPIYAQFPESIWSCIEKELSEYVSLRKIPEVLNEAAILIEKTHTFLYHQSTQLNLSLLTSAMESSQCSPTSKEEGSDQNSNSECSSSFNKLIEKIDNLQYLHSLVEDSLSTLVRRADQNKNSNNLNADVLTVTHNPNISFRASLPPKYKKVPSAKAFHSCVLCHRNHDSRQCRNYTTFNGRETRLKQLHLCIHCGYLRHMGSCASKKKCKECSLPFNVCLCKMPY